MVYNVTMTLLIDFDDTVHNTHDTRPGYKMGQPELGAVEALTRLHNNGDKIIILTGRPVNKPAVYKAVHDWMVHFRVPFDEITNVKPSGYDFVIDNRAIHYDNWPSTLLLLHRLDTKQAEQKFTHDDGLTTSDTKV